MATFKTILLSAGILVYSLLGCNFPKLGIYPERAKIHARNNYSGNCEANKKSIDALLSDIWHSGFLKQSEEVKQEILNNRYGVINESSNLESFFRDEEQAGGEDIEGLKDAIEVCKGRRIRECFINRAGTDYLILKERLFCHLEFDYGGNIKYKGKDKRIRATFLHGLLHDFWHNSLELEKKLEFAIEGEIFYNEMLLAKADDEKLKFLRKVGFANAKLEDFEAYAALKKKKESYKEKLREFFGSELYSTLADRAFTGEMIIPKQMRKFYEKFISKDVLNKDGK